MLLSAFLIVWTLQSDSWWHKLLHFIFIISNNHFSLTSIVYNRRTACCVMKFKAVYRLEGSQALFTYIYIYFVFPQQANRHDECMAAVPLGHVAPCRTDLWSGNFQLYCKVWRASVCFYYRGASSSCQHVVQ